MREWGRLEAGVSFREVILYRVSILRMSALGDKRTSEYSGRTAAHLARLPSFRRTRVGLRLLAGYASEESSGISSVCWLTHDSIQHTTPRPGWPAPAVRALTMRASYLPHFSQEGLDTRTARADLSERAFFLTMPFQPTVKYVCGEHPADAGAAEMCCRHDLARRFPHLAYQASPPSQEGWLHLVGLAQAT